MNDSDAKAIWRKNRTALLLAALQEIVEMPTGEPDDAAEMKRVALYALHNYGKKK